MRKLKAFYLESEDPEKTCYSCRHKVDIPTCRGEYGETPQPGQTFCQENMWHDEMLTPDGKPFDSCTLHEFNFMSSTDKLPF